MSDVRCQMSAIDSSSSSFSYSSSKGAQPSGASQTAKSSPKGEAGPPSQTLMSAVLRSRFVLVLLLLLVLDAWAFNVQGSRFKVQGSRSPSSNPPVASGLRHTRAPSTHPFSGQSVRAPLFIRHLIRSRLTLASLHPRSSQFEGSAVTPDRCLNHPADGSVRAPLHSLMPHGARSVASSLQAPGPALPMARTRKA